MPSFDWPAAKRLIASFHAAIMGYDATNDKLVPIAVDSNGIVATAPSGASTSTTAVTGTQATKTVAATGTPERLAAATTLCESVLLEGKKARATNNTSSVFVGWTSVNDTQLLEVRAGEGVTLSAPAGKKLDLNLIYVDVLTNADGITYTIIN